MPPPAVIALLLGAFAGLGVWARMRYGDQTPNWITNATLTGAIVLFLVGLGSGLDLLGYAWFRSQPLWAYVAGGVCVAVLVWLWNSGLPLSQPKAESAKDHNVTSYGQTGGITAHTVHGAENANRRRREEG